MFILTVQNLFFKGGTWFITINKINDSYSHFNAESYAGIEVTKKYTRTLFDGELKPWVREDPTAFAPSGYGLGAEPAYVSDANTCKNNGWFYIDENTVNKPTHINYAILFVYRRNSVEYVQEVVDVTRGLKAIRNCYDGATWNEWAYDNPPMVLGVEYRTTKRYENHAVYTQMISCGKGPASGGANYYLNLNTNNIIFTQIRCKAVSPTSYWGAFLDHYILFGEYGSGAPCVSLSADAGDQSNRDIYLIVEYYKV